MEPETRHIKISKIDRANEKLNKCHINMYPNRYLCISGSMLHFLVLWGQSMDDGIGISVGQGVTLLLLLCPSCLSFAKTNKIKLNCLKIAKNETKCQRGATGKRL